MSDCLRSRIGVVTPGPATVLESLGGRFQLLTLARSGSIQSCSSVVPACISAARALQSCFSGPDGADFASLPTVGPRLGCGPTKPCCCRPRTANGGPFFSNCGGHPAFREPEHCAVLRTSAVSNITKLEAAVIAASVISGSCVPSIRRRVESLPHSSLDLGFLPQALISPNAAGGAEQTSSQNTNKPRTN